MRLGNGASWRIAIDEPSDLHLALFVRDACRLERNGLRSPGSLNPGVPDLTDVVSELARPNASTSWSDWWDRILAAHRSPPQVLPEAATLHERAFQLRRMAALADGPQFGCLAQTVELQTAARASFSAFQSWWSPPEELVSRADSPLTFSGVRGQLIGLHLGSTVVHETMTTVERQLGRKAKPFHLSIEILAVADPPVIVHEEHYALVAASLVADQNAYRDWLRRFVREMA